METIKKKENEKCIDHLEKHVLNLQIKYPNSFLIFGGDFNVALDNI